MSTTPVFENIAQSILAELGQANKEIKAALAWFTDSEIISLLEKKVEEGVSVDLILAENEHNDAAKYATLREAGAEVLFVPARGYGTMHHKFCVIDEEVVITGSYNWTVNARKNNNENILIHKDQSTAIDYLNQFHMLKRNITSTEENTAIEQPEIEVPNNYLESKTEVSFKNILDSIISAEVSQYNRADIKKQGYEAAENSNGDSQVLMNCFDSLYSGFVSSIDLIEEKKRNLLSKIEEQKTKSLDSIEAQSELKIAQVESKSQLRINNLELDISDQNSCISINESRSKKIHDHDIENVEKDKKSLREEIDRMDIEFVQPKIKLYELIPTAIINVGLIVYIFLFYSSAAYILLFSKADFEEAQLNGVKIPPPEVFNSSALSMALDKGFGAFLILILFVFIPLTLATVNRFIKSHDYFSQLNESFTRVFTYLAFIVVDGFIAYSVTKSIYDIARRRGDVLVDWEFSMIWSNPNFYLVFVMGALGLFLFDLAYERLMRIFEERNPDHDQRVREKSKEQKRNSLKDLNKKQEVLAGEIQSLTEKNTEHSQIILKRKQEIEQEENNVKAEITSIKSKERIEKDAIERISDIYKTHVMNDQYAVSKHAIKDRVNTFLDGWITYLNDKFSVKLARDFTNQANLKAEEWSSKLKLTNQVNA